MVAPRKGLVLLLSSTGGRALPGGPFRLGIPYQAHVDIPLPEVHPSGDPGPDILGSEDAQHLCKNYVGKDEEYLRVPTPAKDTPPFQS